MTIASRIAVLALAASAPLAAAGCSGGAEPGAKTSESVTYCAHHAIEIGYAGGPPEWIGSAHWDDLWRTSLGEPHARICHAYVPWDVAFLPDSLPAHGDATAEAKRADALRRGWGARAYFQEFHDRATSPQERCELMVVFKRHTAKDPQWIDGRTYRPWDSDPANAADLSSAFAFRDAYPTSVADVERAFAKFRRTWPDVHVFESWNEWNNDEPDGNGFNDQDGVIRRHLTARDAALYYLAMRRQCHPNDDCAIAAGALFVTGPWTVTRDFEQYQGYVEQNAREQGLPAGFRPEIVSYHPWAGWPTPTEQYKEQTDELLHHLGGSWSRARVWLTEFGHTGDSGEIEDVLQFLYDRPRITRWYYFDFGSLNCGSNPDTECAPLDMLRNRGDVQSGCPGVYENPLLAGGDGRWAQCPDPNVRRDGSRYVLACTSPHVGWDANAFPIRVSADLVRWSAPRYVFSRDHHPGWAKPPGEGAYWAPEIYRLDGKWLLVFAGPTADPAKKGSLGIGWATADSIDGPWTAGDEPLISQGDGSTHGPGDATSGRIDPTLLYDQNTGEVYRDPGTGHLYLYYVYQPRWVRVVQLADDGKGHLSALRSTDTQLVLTTGQEFEATLPWEGTTVEGVEANVKDGEVYLLYSGNSTWNGTYAVGVARSASPEGPFEKRPDPILRAAPGGFLVGPGHSSQWVRGPDGNPYLFYHVQLRGVTGVSKPRLLSLDQVWFDTQGWPRVAAGYPSEGVLTIP